jgi:hypothetical protein
MSLEPRYNCKWFSHVHYSKGSIDNQLIMTYRERKRDMADAVTLHMHEQNCILKHCLIDLYYCCFEIRAWTKPHFKTLSCRLQLLLLWDSCRNNLNGLDFAQINSKVWDISGDTNSCGTPSRTKIILEPIKNIEQSTLRFVPN